MQQKIMGILSEPIQATVDFFDRTLRSEFGKAVESFLPTLSKVEVTLKPQNIVIDDDGLKRQKVDVSLDPWSHTFEDDVNVIAAKLNLDWRWEPSI